MMRFRAPKALKARFLRVTAQERADTGVNMSDVLRRVILEYVEKLEDGQETKKDRQ